MMLHGKEYV